MKNLLKLEELAMLGLSIYALILMDVKWWYYILLLLGPDVSMIGYIFGNRIGAFSYNLFHHKAVAIAFFVIGMAANIHLMKILGIVLFGHSSMDRIFGYGLKLHSGFKHTHLGIIGKEK
jgi:hypothetical protein